MWLWLDLTGIFFSWPTMVFGKIDCELAANGPFGLFVGCMSDGFVVTADDDRDLYKTNKKKMQQEKRKSERKS